MSNVEHDRLTSAEAVSEDKTFDRAIRPKTLADYHGQPSVNEQMSVFIEAARRREEALDHSYCADLCIDGHEKHDRRGTPKGSSGGMGLRR